MFREPEGPGFQDSSKGGAVETGCSDLYAFILVIYCIILPPSAAPPSDCTPPCNEYPGLPEAVRHARYRGLCSCCVCASTSIVSGFAALVVFSPTGTCMCITNQHTTAVPLGIVTNCSAAST